MLNPNICFNDIESAVCVYFQITADELRVRSHFHADCRRRFILVFLARELTDLSFPAIGARLGRHHSSIILAERRAAELFHKKEKFAADLRAVRELIQIRAPYMERLKRAQSDFGGLTKPAPAALSPRSVN